MAEGSEIFLKTDETLLTLEWCSREDQLLAQTLTQHRPSQSPGQSNKLFCCRGLLHTQWTLGGTLALDTSSRARWG